MTHQNIKKQFNTSVPEEEEKAFFHAIIDNDEAAVMAFLKKNELGAVNVKSQSTFTHKGQAVYKDRTGLMIAASYSSPHIVQVLLEHGARVDEEECHLQQRALIFAVSWGQKENVRLLLKAGADYKHVYKNGITARSLACTRSHVEIVALLEKWDAAQQELAKKRERDLAQALVDLKEMRVHGFPRAIPAAKKPVFKPKS